MIRNSVYFFVALALAAVAAFWPSYFSRVSHESELRVHLHGAIMSSWCLLLITQAYLIRSDRREWHRHTGKVSFVLVPLVILSTLTLERFRLSGGLTTELLYFFYVVLSLLGLFVLVYSLAIYHRRTPGLHMRYMVCSALPLIDPIGARLIYNHLGIGYPMGQVMTFGAMDLVLLCLVIWDRKLVARFPVFPVMLVVFAIVQIPTFFLFRLPLWRAFAEWYGRVPLP